MINEEEYISYFENLAIDSREINHTLEGKETFFCIDNPDNMQEFDNALRNCVGSPAFLLVADHGEFNDNNSVNHTQEINGQFYIVAKKTDELSIRQARALCLPIALNFLARMKKDAREKKIIPGKLITFRIDNIPYQKVSEMNVVWYGYTVWFTFTCPFGFTVDSGTWRNNNLPLPASSDGDLPSNLA
jgi:hypothetical protein